MTDHQNPLEGLLVSDTDPINKKELADLLTPYINIDQKEKSFNFIGEFMKLNNADKIYLILSAVKARSMLFNDMEDKISPVDIVKMDIMPEGSVKATLKKLKDDNKISSDNGKYYLPNYKLHDILAYFNK